MDNQRTKYRYKRKKEVVDTTTGECTIATEFERYQQDTFYKVFQNGRGRMFPKGMSGATHEVIQWLILNLRKDNLVFFDAEAMHTEIGVSPANAKKIKATLLAKDVIRPKTKIGHVFLFNPNYGCRVSGSERANIYEEYMQLPAPPPEKEPTQAGHDAFERDETRKWKRHHTDEV